MHNFKTLLKIYSHIVKQLRTKT